MDNDIVLSQVTLVDGSPYQGGRTPRRDPISHRRGSRRTRSARSREGRSAACGPARSWQHRFGAGRHARRLGMDVARAIRTGQIGMAIWQEITFARVCTAFAVLALTIACVGLYGTVAYNVARRTNEIGIRMALGAPRPLVIRMILKKVMITVFAALVVGLPLALKASSAVESFLFAMKPNDPAVIIAAVVILITAALLAAFIPAHRASRIDPLTALRHD